MSPANPGVSQNWIHILNQEIHRKIELENDLGHGEMKKDGSCTFGEKPRTYKLARVGFFQLVNVGDFRVENNNTLFSLSIRPLSNDNLSRHMRREYLQH